MTQLAYSYPDSSLEALFRKIAVDKTRHAQFLNTISMLEYIGARKIMKSQQADEMSLTLLTHASEEIKHAWLVKRLAQQLDKSSTRTYAYSDLLCGKEAEAYIQDLDLAVERYLGNEDKPQNQFSAGWLNYLYTSLLIEERAEVFYAAYAIVLDELGIAKTLKSIMKDESKHLAQMAQKIADVDVDASSRLASLREVEKAAFGRWMNALWSCVEN